MNLAITIINNQGLSEKEVLKEILLAEIRMNAGSRLRFHINEVEYLGVECTSVKYTPLIPKNDIKYFERLKHKNNG